MFLFFCCSTLPVFIPLSLPLSLSFSAAVDFVFLFVTLAASCCSGGCLVMAILTNQSVPLKSEDERSVWQLMCVCPMTWTACQCQCFEGKRMGTSHWIYPPQKRYTSAEHCRNNKCQPSFFFLPSLSLFFYPSFPLSLCVIYLSHTYTSYAACAIFYSTLSRRNVFK